MDIYCVEYRFGTVSNSSVLILERDCLSALKKAHKLFPEYGRRSKGGDVFPCDYVELDESGRAIIKRKAAKIVVRHRKPKQLPLFGISNDSGQL